MDGGGELLTGDRDWELWAKPASEAIRPKLRSGENQRLLMINLYLSCLRRKKARVKITPALRHFTAGHSASAEKFGDDCSLCQACEIARRNQP